ncbi:hypothetical protein PGTUg99_012537 [Puccinia graminis f. sp. tritici]|uniref:Uncharacterized protein n=1 Tax=Puccinia graminis f. sp. tritici TaxID=56615 RepID=A0A5B0NUN3_PUCGR|nr:hypothetical protein PGTUg99_012537 [Puccinia graminis f. sp. tritici]
MLWLEKAASPVLDDLVLVWPIRRPYECLLTAQRLQFEFRDCTAQYQPFSSNCWAGLKLSDHPESNFYSLQQLSQPLQIFTMPKNTSPNQSNMSHLSPTPSPKPHIYVLKTLPHSDLLDMPSNTIWLDSLKRYGCAIF